VYKQKANGCAFLWRIQSIFVVGRQKSPPKLANFSIYTIKFYPRLSLAGAEEDGRFNGFFFFPSFLVCVLKLLLAGSESRLLLVQSKI